ncbi:MAG: hypothetical protein JSW61_07400 [Candidatus Thorarchaeota archaeon]|nr:MAG: hypothetical protein JSW61_07400 [Candidatus Thorarchaeota archaeon]
MPVRIKAVLRDQAILQMQPGSQDRIISVFEKNRDRLVNLSSLLKVMGLPFEDRLKMLQTMSERNEHIWLGNESGQHVVYISNAELPPEIELPMYKWQ